MTSVLTAFRDNGDKVAAAIAECRRLGIEVLPPDVHRSHLEFTVEGEAIRFGLLAVKNVGEGAIESIIRAREEGGEFRSLVDLCSRIDLRLANRKVLESLARVGALGAFGHPARILLGLDDAMAAAQAAQRDRTSGQTSLFDAGAEDAALLERPLPAATEAPVRERLRWEKELLGLYLSEHPMGEVADRVGAYVTAFSGDLRDESLDGQRVVLGGIVTGVRTVITRAKQTMAIVTLEDLQGTCEVVVFPRMHEQTAGTWQEGTIVLVAGRVDHRGEEVSLLADLVVEWDAAVIRGPEAFARDVAAGERGAVRRRPPTGTGNGNGSGNGSGRGNGTGSGPRPAAIRRDGGPGIPVGPGPSPTSAVPVAAAAAMTARRPGVPLVSPLRAEARPPGADPLGLLTVVAIAPPEPIRTYAEPDGATPAAPDAEEEPALPDEVRARAASAAEAPTTAVEVAGDRVLHVRFAATAPADRVIAALESLRSVIRDRPGETRVVIHVPGAAGAPLPMELRSGVAYDVDLLAVVERRLGGGLVELRLA
jgi:hypothetical protein